MSSPLTNWPFVAGLVAFIGAALVGLAPSRPQHLVPTVPLMLVIGLFLASSAFVLPLEVYRPAASIAVALCLLVPVLAASSSDVPGDARKDRAPTTVLAGLAFLAGLDATGATELFTGHMTGVGVQFVLGWAPGVPHFCQRSALRPLLFSAAVVLTWLMYAHRRRTDVLRFSLAGALLLAGVFLTRDVGECRVGPAELAQNAAVQRSRVSAVMGARERSD